MALYDPAMYASTIFSPYVPATSSSTTGATIGIGTVFCLAGAAIVVVVKEATATAPGTISDTVNTYTLVASQAESPTGIAMVFVAANAAQMVGQTVTYTKNVSGSVVSASILVIMSAAGTTVDASFTASLATASATPSVTSNPAAATGEFVIGLLTFNAGSALSITQPTGWTSLATSQAQLSAQHTVAYLVNPTAGAQTYAPTLGGAPTSGAMAIIAIRRGTTHKGYYDVMWWTNHTAVAGELIRQFAVTSGNERVFVCTTPGATAATEPAWAVTRGASTSTGAAVYFECTGVAAVNGDTVNTPTWTAYKAFTATATLGQCIQRGNGASYWICTVGGAMGASEPAWPNDTAGTTQVDNAATWTCIGVVGNFTGWQAPHLRGQSAWNWNNATSFMYFASSHIEATATTISLNGNNISVGQAHVPPQYPADVALGTVFANGTGIFTINGTFYAESIYFIGSLNGANQMQFISGPPNIQYLKNCRVYHWNYSSNIQFIGLAGSNYSKVTWDNVGLWHLNAGDNWKVDADFTWKNTAAPYPNGNPLGFVVSGGQFCSGTHRFVGVDFTVASGKTLHGGGNAQSIGSFTVQDCKLPASITIIAPQSRSFPGFNFRSDSAGTNYRHEKYDVDGTQVVDTTTVRSGGASDGTTPIAWKITTTVNPAWFQPFESIPLSIWNDNVTGPVTVSVYGIWSGAAVPNNDDIWMEIDYLGAAASTLGTIATLTKASAFAPNAPLATDNSAWGGAQTRPFVMRLTLNSPQPGQRGPLAITVKAARPSSTFWIDPRPVLS